MNFSCRRYINDYERRNWYVGVLLVYEIVGHRFNKRYGTLNSAMRACGRSEGPILEHTYVGPRGDTGSEKFRHAFDPQGNEISDYIPKGKAITGHGPERHVSAYDRPLVAQSMGVHPSQVAQFNEDAKRHGTGAFYRPDGNPEFSSRGARAREMRRRNMFDKQAGYSDWAGDKFKSSQEVTQENN
jgi:hypothetical protein